MKRPSGYIAALALITVFNLVVLEIRNLLVGNRGYDFLLWNLFLAFVPLAIAWWCLKVGDTWNKWVIVLLSCAWLLFYPNSPYMISDMIHVDPTRSYVLYDTLLLFSLAMLGLFYGFYSLKLIHVLYKNLFGQRIGHLVVTASIILSSFGIYLGRILRLNSWDLFTRPLWVLSTIWDHLVPVSRNPTTYAVIFIFSILQFILLVMMKDMDEIKVGKLISGDHRP